VKNKPRQKGFTLIEILVVMVIVSFITGLLMGALHQVYQLQLKIERGVGNDEQRDLVEKWLRNLIGALQAEHLGNNRDFRGERLALSGLSNISLSPKSLGGIAPFSLIISSSPEGRFSNLTYIQGMEKQPLIEGDEGEMYFDFVDKEGARYDFWPPKPDAPQLPALVCLHRLIEGRDKQLYFHPESADRPLPSLQGLFEQAKVGP